MGWPLRRKLFVTVGAGAAALALVMSLLLDLTVVKEVQDHEDRALEQTQAAFEALQRYRRTQLLERCRLVSELPYFKAAVAVYDPTLPAARQTEALATVSDVARRILTQIDVDLVTLTDIEGNPLFAVGSSVEQGMNDLTPLSGIAQKAVKQVASDGFLVLSEELVYVTAVQVEVGGYRLGALCLGTTLDAQLAHSLEEMTGSAVALLGNNGILAQSDGVPAAAAEALPGRLAGAAGASTPRGRDLLEIEGSRYRSLWIPLRGPDEASLGAFVVLRSENDALAFLARVREGLIAIASVAVVVALVFSFLFARQITGPVQKLVAFAERMGRGDLEARVDIGTRDELALLGASFNHMASSLAESRRHLEKSNRILEVRSTELEAANRDLHLSKEETEKTNRALEEAHAQIIQAGKMAAFGELGAGLAHELKQPLASIRGFAQLMQMKLGPDDADAQRYLKLIIQSVDHMTKIVQGLKDFARQSSFEFLEVNVNEVLERTCLLLEGQMKSRHIRLTKDLAAGLPIVSGEPNQLQQVFTNLIANARDALDEAGGNVTVKSQALGDGSYVLVSVTDDGPGIAPEHLPKIFQSFFTTKPEGKGTGLGLSITQGIVQDHGGRLDVSSRPREATTFRVFLPSVAAKNCWEMIDCVRDCRPEIASKEECAVYRDRRGHRCWESLRELARQNPEVTQPQCDRCPVYMAKTAFLPHDAIPGPDRKAA